MIKDHLNREVHVSVENGLLVINSAVGKLRLYAEDWLKLQDEVAPLTPQLSFKAPPSFDPTKNPGQASPL